ncbi:hypothetical protein GOODEAATRI_000642 [Goodea atripinnis]|uniref:tRNA (32-2'-O)-methyltransferase regulator THADA-like TPR repeats region domain-containing protein n=1 Tax=Goodea atripinnis TaxID=208336 RepID=A0ABV0MNR5_9TELE
MHPLPLLSSPTKLPSLLMEEKMESTFLPRPCSCDVSVPMVLQAGSQLEALNEEHAGGTLDACLNALALVYTSVQAKNPLRRAVASGLAGRHIAQAQLMQSCLAVVKTSMLVLQRSQDALSEVLQAEQDTPGSLLSCYIHILLDGVAFFSDGRFIWPPAGEFIQAIQSTAGMAVVLLISIKESSTAMVVARVLTLWSGAALDCLQEETQLCPPSLQVAFCGGSELQRHLLEHIYSHWEHPLDGVRHQTRSLFHNLLRLHQHTKPSSSNAAEDPYITELTRSLLGLEWHMRGKYGSLGCLVELHGAEHLLSIQPLLPSHLLDLMGDQTLAPYASDLLERLFISHKAQLAREASEETRDWMERWHRTWVNPLLHVLCHTSPDQTTYILDYFLPKLLRCSPSSLAHMVRALQDMPPCRTGIKLTPQVFQLFVTDHFFSASKTKYSCFFSLLPGLSSSRGALGALMTCLRAARAQGVISSEEGLWGGLIPLSLLQQALIHKHDQVRMDALGLVCESHRSTEVLTSQEMDLIRHFLPPNLNSQSPGVRQQTVSLLKKVRARAEVDVGFTWLPLLTAERSSDNLCAPQLLCRVKDSSQLLQKRLVQERDQEGRAKGQHSLNQYKVQRTKGPCVMICSEVPETMRCVLQAALDLSTSTKPYDSVTAAHLLHLLLQQPELIPVLLRAAQDVGLDLQICPPLAQASEVLVLELNTLAVVQFLLRCLQTELSGAELSLLQAAASFPLYGRAHCITAVLQHLNTEMSDVVSPVVQSSSPEGLIPMDTDSGNLTLLQSPLRKPGKGQDGVNNVTCVCTETSGGLQRILQEIQPRDTNDFFNSARELETPQEDDGTHWFNGRDAPPFPPHSFQIASNTSRKTAHTADNGTHSACTDSHMNGLSECSSQLSTAAVRAPPAPSHVTVTVAAIFTPGEVSPVLGVHSRSPAVSLSQHRTSSTLRSELSAARKKRRGLETRGQRETPTQFIRGKDQTVCSVIWRIESHDRRCTVFVLYCWISEA